ncbi:probable G-protein coupled receptor 132b [Thunnus maccoyii]|uniref:probable G-protein coupled receptor 132b n=1 Tax=Thunnus maccoyii TaxID=8240 RepID=UPI001C4CEB8A|nr:probable G-protein coupled receptor 132b [Thunnus maccoyii]
MHAVTETVAPSTNGSNNGTQMGCELPYDDGRLPLVLLYSVVLVVGLPANLLTVYLTWLQVRRKNVLGVYLWSLSLCDLTYLGTLPLWAYYVSNDHRWPWSSAACKLTGYIFFNNMYISIFLLCCVSCDRYMAVVYSVESRGLRRQRLAAGIAISIVLVVAIGHVPVFTMREGDAAGHGHHRCFEPSQSSATVTGFYYARFVVGFLIPLLLLVATNRGILAGVQRSTGLRQEQKERVRWLAVAVVLLFLVCFAPYHLILLVRAFNFHFPQLEDSCQGETSMYTPYTISLGLSTVNSAVNPVLYVLSSDNIRKELRRGLARLCDRAHLRPPSNSSQNKIQPTRNSSELPADSQRHPAGEDGRSGKPPGT